MSKILASTVFSATLKFVSLLCMTDHVSHPHYTVDGTLIMFTNWDTESVWPNILNIITVQHLEKTEM
jgi:hypothetical protein